MRELTLDVILRAVFGTSDERLAANIRATLGVARSCAGRRDVARPARPRAAQPVGAPSCGAWPWSTSS
jgi:hypothetical protein